MYKIYFAELGKATGIKEIGTRPVVLISENDKECMVLKITSRNRDDRKHVRMNPYIINGFCDISQTYFIDKKYLKDYMRDCTKSEYSSIREKIRNKKFMQVGE